MNTIGADAATLAGLQIDQLQKVREGHITLDHLRWFNNLTHSQRDMLSGADISALKDPRFTSVATFEVTVPDGYDHATRLDTFKAAHESEFCYGYNQNITDRNYAGATTKLIPGRRFQVEVFQITERVTSDDCLAFLKSQKAVLVGAQGATLAYEQGKDKLPKGRWSISFDEKKALWKDADGYHRVPCVYRDSDGGFGFYLGYFERAWDVDDCLLCFRDLSLETRTL